MSFDHGSLSLADFLNKRDELFGKIAAVTNRTADQVADELKRRTNYVADRNGIIAELETMYQEAIAGPPIIGGETEQNVC